LPEYYDDDDDDGQLMMIEGGQLIACHLISVQLERK